VVAELSGNHNQSFERAVDLVRAAADAGADAVKLQTYTADSLTIASDGEWFRVAPGSPWAGKTLHELYAEAYTPWEWQPRIQEVALRAGLQLFSTPFDTTAIDFLEGMAVPAHKIASFELVDHQLLEAIARTGKPVILSTGLATLVEIEQAVDTLRRHGTRELALLKCTSAYPAPVRDMNLRTIPDMASRFGAVAGLSDHSLAPVVSLSAVALGASIVEKHFTLRRSDGGPDAEFSLEPQEFHDLVQSIRDVEAAVGHVSYAPTPSEEASRCFRRSLFVVEDVKRGERFTSRSVRSIRPGYGLPPRDLAGVLGRTAARDIPRGTPLSWDLVDAAS
jgi:pseudaminic acid synthase